MENWSFCGWLSWMTRRRSVEFGTGSLVQRQHQVVGLHAGDFALAVQQQRDAVQFPLHHLEIEQRGLPHQAGQDVDLRQHLGGKEQFAFRFRAGLPSRKT